MIVLIWGLCGVIANILILYKLRKELRNYIKNSIGTYNGGEIAFAVLFIIPLW